ncbi:hypothetical protein R3P38DRAFT_2804950 [Favolaschia claudopus]|uniref:Uncharacterized protein n=1 Tax=Favolaschia claudopus TaxID=2862362 RepID=A0AAV9ZP75_9AGAR
MSQMAYKPWLELKRLNSTTGPSSDRLNRASQRFRDINLKWYRRCVNDPPIKAIRNPASQYQSRDVKVGDNSTARMLGFGKEIEEHTIQQGSVRVNNAMQQDIGELAAHSCPLERKGNQGHQCEGKRDCTETQYKASRVITVNRRAHSETSYGNGELGTQFLQKGPRTRGIRGNNDSVGGNRGQLRKIPPKSREFGATAGIGGNTNSARTFRQETNTQ